MSELKPCPFCGEKPELYVDEVDLNGSSTADSFSYYCDSCEFSRGEFLHIEQAEESWNARADDNLTERVKELEVENESLKSGLRIIADPVAYLEEQARFFGNEFKSTAAVSLSRDSDWLKGIARQLLEKE